MTKYSSRQQLMSVDRNQEVKKKKKKKKSRGQPKGIPLKNS